MNGELRERLEAKSEQLDIPLIGIAPAERWGEEPMHPWVPEQFRPLSIWPEVRSVVVIGLPVDLPVVETAPSIYYHEMYKTVNALLDQSAYRLARFLDRSGHPSIYIPRDGYGSLTVLKKDPFAFFSHRHAAYLAGLGSFGVNNMLLTPAYGPRVRFTSIFTTAELPADSIMEEDLCTRCMRCSRLCPAEALDRKGYPEGITRKDACIAYNEKLSGRHVSPCGWCIRVCPVGEDRERFERTSPQMYEREDVRPELHRAWEHVRSHGSEQD